MLAGRTDQLAIDLDVAVGDELSRLPRAACKECSEDGGVQSSLRRVIGHLHVWCSRRHPSWASCGRALQARTSSGSLFRSIGTCQMVWIHGHYCVGKALKHSAPLPLAHLLAVVCPGHGLG